jgi:predicted transcriptional regulator
MTKRSGSTTLSIYIPRKKDGERLTERLARMAEQRDRSVNYLVVEAISEYLDRAEAEKKGKT